MAKRPKKCVVLHSKTPGKFYFHQVAGNGEISAPSQLYTRRWTAHRAIIDLFGPNMKIEDSFDKPKARKARKAKAPKAA